MTGTECQPRNQGSNNAAEARMILGKLSFEPLLILKESIGNLETMSQLIRVAYIMMATGFLTRPMVNASELFQ